MNKREIEKAINILKSQVNNLEMTLIEEPRYPFRSSIERQIESIGLAISALEQQLTNGWIPVSERLPDAHKRYLVSMKHKSLNETFIDCRFYDLGYQFEYQDSLERHNWEVAAWQPLPEPYKEDKDAERN